jgi:hypothetical protein
MRVGGCLSPYFTVVQPHFTVVQPHFTVVQPYFTVVQPYFAVVQPHVAFVQSNLTIVQPYVAIVPPGPSVARSSEKADHSTHPPIWWWTVFGFHFVPGCVGCRVVCFGQREASGE